MFFKPALNQQAFFNFELFKMSDLLSKHNTFF